MGVIRYSCPIRLVPTYILPAKDIQLLWKFKLDSFKTDGLVCVETDGQTDTARSTRLVMLIKNIYTLWGRKRLLHCVANFWLKSIYPLQGYKNAKAFADPDKALPFNIDTIATIKTDEEPVYSKSYPHHMGVTEFVNAEDKQLFQ